MSLSGAQGVVGSKPQAVAAAAGAVAATAIVVAALRRQRREAAIHSTRALDPPRQLRVPEVRAASTADLLATLQQALPLKLPALSRDVVDASVLLGGGADAAAADMVYPGNRIGVSSLFNGVKLGALCANIALELASADAGGSDTPTPPHPLRAVPIDFFEAEQIAARLEAHRRCELYAMASVASLPASLQERLQAAAEPLLRLAAGHWAQVSTNLWVGASSGSLHYDERDNVLLQLSGTKRVVLFPLEHAGACRMHAVMSRLPNHSSYNQSFLTAGARASNAALAAAAHYMVELQPGDALVIPAGVPHAPVGSLDSVSLNMFLGDGPSPSPRSSWLRARFHLSVAARSVFSLHLPHIGGSKLQFTKAQIPPLLLPAAQATDSGGVQAAGREQEVVKTAVAAAAAAADAQPKITTGHVAGGDAEALSVPRPDGPDDLALVTGASQGIGLAVCRRLLDAGWRVVALCRAQSAELEDLAGSRGASLRVVSGVDLLASAAEVASTVDGALSGFAVGLVVHSAGLGSADTLDDLAAASGYEQPEQQCVSRFA